MDNMRKLRATAIASRRTKNKLKEHGPNFNLVGEVKFVECIPGRPEVLAACLHSPDDWMGWVPCDEIEIDENNREEQKKA